MFTDISHLSLYVVLSNNKETKFIEQYINNVITTPV